MPDEKLYATLPTDRVSANAGVVQLEAGAAAYVASRKCRSCLIGAASSAANAWLNIDAAATASCMILPLIRDGGYLELAIANLSIINVYAAAAVTVCIIWRD